MAIAHSPSFAKKAGVRQKVGKDFAAADKAAGMVKKPSAPKMSAKMMGAGTNRAGRIDPVQTDRGAFRFKKNRAGD